jgi:hypothetical protein
MSTSRHLRRELPSSASRLALHRAWAAFNRDAWIALNLETRAELTKHIAIEPPGGAVTVLHNRPAPSHPGESTP